MPEVESVDDHYKQNINEYYRITVKHSGRVPYINSNLYYDDVILLSYPAQQQILIPKQNAQEIIDQLIEESLLQRDISTEQIIDDLENRQKQEIAYEKQQAEELLAIHEKIALMKKDDPVLYHAIQKKITARKEKGYNERAIESYLRYLFRTMDKNKQNKLILESNTDTKEHTEDEQAQFYPCRIM